MKTPNTFSILSPGLKAYLLSWYSAGIAALGYSAWSLTPGNRQSLIWYLALSVALSLKTVRGASTSVSGKACVSMASAAAFGAIVGICPMAGAIVEAASTILDSVFPKRRALHQAAFNVSVVAVGALAAGLVYKALGGPTIVFSRWSALPDIAAAAGPMLIATTTYFLINTLAVAEVVALASGVPFMDIWKRSFKTTFVAYTTGGACAILFLGLSGHMPIMSVALLCAPIIYASYSREHVDEARVVALEMGQERLHGLYLAAIRTLALTVAAKDPYTNGHIHRVTAFATAMGRHMGLSHDELTDLQVGALLHDIGKIGVPENILTKPGRLEPDEMAMMRRHPDIGWAILEPIEFPAVVKQIVRHHHEWHNGTGYPDRLEGACIPLMVTIVSMSDVYDALTSHRPYRPALTNEAAREIMRQNSGSQFHPDILQTFFQVLDTMTPEQVYDGQSAAPALSEILSTLEDAGPARKALAPRHAHPAPALGS
jgi:putative nucleotidyltransferase with HDIG domain